MMKTDAVRARIRSCPACDMKAKHAALPPQEKAMLMQAVREDPTILMEIAEKDSSLAGIIQAEAGQPGAMLGGETGNIDIPGDIAQAIGMQNLEALRRGLVDPSVVARAIQENVRAPQPPRPDGAPGAMPGPGLRGMQTGSVY